MEIKIASEKFALSLLMVVAFLLAINILGLFFFFCITGYQIFDIVAWFDFDYENNIPALYSGFILLSCSFFLLIISVSKHREIYAHSAYWFVLSILFAYLAIDEICAIHEHIGKITEHFVTAKGFFFFPWVIPYGIFLIFFILVYLRFLAALPLKIRTWFIASGIIFLSGAVGFEMFGAKEADLHGINSLKYCILYTIEEFFEMTGIVCFNYSLLYYIKHEIKYLSVFKIKQISFS